jgi:hypothetical protein
MAMVHLLAHGKYAAAFIVQMMRVAHLGFGKAVQVLVKVNPIWTVFLNFPPST